MREEEDENIVRKTKDINQDGGSKKFESDIVT